MNFNASELGYRELNRKIREYKGSVVIDNCFGERFIGVGLEDKVININGVPGNALGAYLNGATIKVNGNVQDAVGDTMNDGIIVVDGNAGDALGYAMRGGSIYVKGNSGYRTGIHMKQYRDRCPSIIVGGSAGSFLGEYLAGGLIIVLGIGVDKMPLGNFTGMGMHGGVIYLRSDKRPSNLSEQIVVKKADGEDMEKIKDKLINYCEFFDIKMNAILSKPFYILTPNVKNPYKQLYTEN